MSPLELLGVVFEQLHVVDVGESEIFLLILHNEMTQTRLELALQQRDGALTLELKLGSTIQASKRKRHIILVERVVDVLGGVGYEITFCVVLTAQVQLIIVVEQTR